MGNGLKAQPVIHHNPGGATLICDGFGFYLHPKQLLMKFPSLCMLAIILASCGTASSPSTSGDDPVALATKRIKQRIDVDGMGMLENLEVFDVEAKGDSVFQATHTFLNTMFGKELKITRVYTLNAGLDSVVAKTDVSTFMKSEGEWVKSPF